MRRALATLAKRQSSQFVFFADALSPSASGPSLVLPVSARGISQASTSAGSSSTAAASQPFYAVTVLERLPVVAPLPPAYETDYLEWMRAKGRVVEGKRMPAELGGGDEGGGKGSKKSASASASASAAEGETEEDKGKWRPAPRETEADRAGDTSSLRRCLDRRLFLVLGGGSGSSDALTSLPSTEIREGETTRSSAERALSEAVPSLSKKEESSPSVEAYFVGNAPAGHLSLPGSKGTLFFHRAQLVAAGGVDLLSASGSSLLFPQKSQQQQQHAWLTRDELAERLGGGEIGELVKAML